MNIIIVSSLYRPNVGGVETMIHEMSAHLTKLGHKIRILTKRWPETLTDFELIDGIEVFRLPAGTSWDALNNTALYVKEHKKLLEGFDVIHFIGMRRSLPFFISVLASEARIPTVGTVVGSEVPNPGASESDYIWEEGLPIMLDVYKSCSVLSAVSSQTALYAEQALPKLEINLQTVLVGIDEEHYKTIKPLRFHGSSQFIFSLRRLEYSKGIDILINAYIQARNEKSLSEDVCLVIAGDGAERENLTELANNSPYAKDIHFLGTISLHEGLGYLKTALCTVVPSRAEGGGLVNTEANACQCPLIVARVGGTEEYTSKDAALFFEAGNTGDLKNNLVNICSDQALRKNLIQAGKRVSHAMSWNVHTYKYLHMYETAITNGFRQLQPSTEQSAHLYKLTAGIL